MGVTDHPSDLKGPDRLLS